jgi:hypothetical protein
MILAPLFGTTLMMTIAAGPAIDSNATAKLSPQQRSALTQPLVHSATDCIVHAVTSDPRYAAANTDGLGDLIVASMPSCLAPVRAMIDAYDRYYGEGSGEAFFMGPYLDVLPRAVAIAGKKNTP